MLFGITLSTIPFAMSCSDDDDDEGGGSASTTTGVVTSGKRLSSAGDWKYTYNSKGQIVKISDRYNSYEFTYSPNKIITDEEDYGYEISVSYNGQGFITSMTSNISYGDKSSDGLTATVRYNISYSGNHLTRMTVEEKGKEYYNGKTYNISESGTATYEWKNDNLQSATQKSSWDDGEEKESETLTYTFTTDTENKNYYNKYKQCPDVFDLEASFWQGLMYVGLLGDGPQYLPKSCKLVEVYDGDKDTYDYTFKFSFNDDGTLYYADAFSDCYFRYENIESTASKSPVMLIPDTKPKQERIRHHHHRLMHHMK